jgi:hypothetical protein
VPPPITPDQTVRTEPSDEAVLPPSVPLQPAPESRDRRDPLADTDGPARAQMIVAIVLGVMLVGVPLFLIWRPRTVGVPIVPKLDASGNLVPDPPDPIASEAPDDAGAASVTVSDYKVVSCHDPGPKRTLADQCDKPDGLDALVRTAVKDSAACATATSGGGVVPYVVDFSFGSAKKKNVVSVAASKDGRTMKNARAAQ